MAGSHRSRSGGRSQGRARSGGRSAGASRGGRRAPPPRGGGGQGPTIVAILLVVGVVGAIVVIKSGGKSKAAQPAPEIQPSSTTPARAGSGAPQKLAAPSINNDLNQQGKAIVKDIEALYEDAAGLYDEAQEAKAAGERDLAHEAMQKANGLMGQIKDLWNEIVVLMPSNADWDEDATADHYFGKVWNKVNDLQAAIRKTMSAK